MPNRDGTGPNGQGPKTGRGLGHCDEEILSAPISVPDWDKDRMSREEEDSN